MKKLLLSLILILIIGVFTGCIDSNTSVEQQVHSSQENGGQISQVTPVVTGIPSSTVKLGDVPDIYDFYGNKVNPNDIIVVGKLPLDTDRDRTVRLYRDGLIDIRVRYNGLDQVILYEVLNGNPNIIPDPSKKNTYLRVKLYDQNGNVVMFKLHYSYNRQELFDHPPDVHVEEKGGLPIRVHDYDYTSTEKVGKIKEWEIFIYFVDRNKIPTPVPIKSIEI